MIAVATFNKIVQPDHPHKTKNTAKKKFTVLKVQLA